MLQGGKHGLFLGAANLQGGNYGFYEPLQFLTGGLCLPIKRLAVDLMCVRDSSGKPAVRHERGLATDSPTRRGTPKWWKWFVFFNWYS